MEALLGIAVGIVGGAVALPLAFLVLALVCGFVAEALRVARSSGVRAALAWLVLLIESLAAMTLGISLLVLVAAWLLDAHAVATAARAIAATAFWCAIFGLPVYVWLDHPRAWMDDDVAA